MMKKSKVKQAVPALVDEWKRERGFERTPPEELCFSNFLGWVSNNYPSYLRFRARTTAEYDLEQWFEDAIGRPQFYR